MNGFTLTLANIEHLLMVLGGLGLFMTVWTVTLMVVADKGRAQR